MESKYGIGIDIGGTFTDAYLVDLHSGDSVQAKVSTTPEDLVVGIKNSILELSRITRIQTEHLLGNCVKFVHSTTQSTNVIFTRTGAKTGLVTTAGFEDTLAIMRAKRSAGLTILERQHYSMVDKPEPIVARSLIRGVSERIDHSGRVIVPLKEQDVIDKIRDLLDQGVDSIAICLLWSFLNPEHEKKIEKIVRKLSPETFVTTSSSLFPLLGEYERSITVVLNAYVGPLMTKYLDRVSAELVELGLRCPLLIVTSQGGVMTPSVALDRPITTVESGPSAGVIGSQYLANLMGLGNIIVTDVGGTTFKVGVIVDGRAATSQTSVITQFTLNNPAIEILSIGSGGGSIAWLDGTRLRVGPKSAQAFPGPACYGRGGTEPTVTDADIVLGYINPDYFLGGRIKLNKELSFKAIKERIADRVFEGDAVKAASGIREIVDEQMSGLIRKATLERGLDIRQFSLMAYGGAGPTHAGQYASSLPIKNIIIPYFATVHSALGALVSDSVHVHEFSDPQLLGSPDSVIQMAQDNVDRVFASMEKEGVLVLSSEGISESQMEFRRYIYAKYGRQVHSLLVPVSKGEKLRESLEGFESLYEQKYGRGSFYREAGIELVSFRHESIGRLLVPPLKKWDKSNVTQTPKNNRKVYWNSFGDFGDTPIFSGDSLQPGATIKGPAVIEHYGTTIVIHPRQIATVDEYLNTIITRE
ncbi:MAG: hydantoinase/oxoprolinase family protein [Thaumarchaeota archaeon]|nr:hydantoinase/oxoprolinase family protein [Nitrososphaerota archaeon]